MAFLSISNIDHNGFRWYIANLGSPFNNDTYNHALISTGRVADGSYSVPNNVLDSVNAPSYRTSYSTPARTINNLRENTSYTVYAYAVGHDGRHWYAGSDTIRTDTYTPPAPDPPSWYEVIPASPTSLFLNWYDVSGADTYQIQSNRGDRRTTSSGSMYWDGLQPDTYYSFRVRVRVDGVWSSYSSYEGAYTMEATRTDYPRGFSASGQSPTSIRTTWNRVSGASKYEVENTTLGSPPKTVYSSNYTWTGLSPDTTYVFHVRAYDSDNYHTWSYWARTTGSTLEATRTSTPSGLSVSAQSPYSIYINWNSVYGASKYEVECTTIGSPPKTVYSSNYTWTGLSPEKTYRFRVRAYDSSNYYEWSYFTSTVSATTPTDRPDDWSWWNSKTSGREFNLTASEWNAFADRINEFRYYKGLSNYSFTNARSGNVFYAYMFNQARTAIRGMNPPDGVGMTSVDSGDDVNAWYFRNLRDSLNSIR